MRRVKMKTITTNDFCWKRLGPASICKFGIPLSSSGFVHGGMYVTGVQKTLQRVDRNTSVHSIGIYSLRLSLNPKTRKQRPGIPLYLINSGLLYDVIGGKTRAQR